MRQYNVLVTGANGFVGGAVYRSWKTKAFGSGPFVDIHVDGHFGHDTGDIKDIALDKQYDLVIHCASTTHNYHILDDHKIDAETNIVGTARLLSEMERTGSKKIVYVSTFFVNDGYPLGLYGATKLCSEHYCQAYSRTYGMDYCIARLSNVYGASQSCDKPKAAAFNKMLWRIARGECVDLYNEPPPHARDYIHIDDVVSALYAISQDGDSINVYEVGTGSCVPFRELIECACKHSSGGSYKLVDVPSFHKATGLGSYVADIDPLVHLGWRPTIGIRHGIQELMEFYREKLRSDQSE